ncbi:outer membrane lipoprotein carrier protein LolA [Kriegella sp. EG-1]|nr:outer membrane lipoprotein carrier protein LolA [Flavobacteriaceae bacterium EG-1]
MKKFLFLILFTITTIASAQSSAKAKTLLDEVYNKVKGYDNIFIDFKYSLYNAEADINQETRGDVTMQGENYVANFFGATQMYDGKKVYTITPENEEVSIEDKSDDPNAFSPSKLLTFYKQGQTYSWDIEQNVQGRKIQFIKLTPIDTDSEIASQLLGIDVETKHIHKLIMTGKNGTKTTIIVNSFKTNLPLSETLFTFDEGKYESDGFYIIKN